MKKTPTELKSGGTMTAIQVLESFRSRATRMNCGMMTTKNGIVSVAMTMVNFRIMAAIGFAMALLIMWSWLRLKQLEQCRKLLKNLIWFIPLPYIACNCGWITTEVGRQPWLVYKLMRTADGVSAGLGSSQVAFSLILLTFLLVFLSVAAFSLMAVHARKGPLAE
jgi:cytochrome d ubiquinol oxidase subunit I